MAGEERSAMGSAKEVVEGPGEGAHEQQYLRMSREGEEEVCMFVVPRNVVEGSLHRLGPFHNTLELAKTYPPQHLPATFASLAAVKVLVAHCCFLAGNSRKEDELENIRTLLRTIRGKQLREVAITAHLLNIKDLSDQALEAWNAFERATTSPQEMRRELGLPAPASEKEVWLPVPNPTGCSIILLYNSWLSRALKAGARQGADERDVDALAAYVEGTSASAGCSRSSGSKSRSQSCRGKKAERKAKSDSIHSQLQGSRSASESAAGSYTGPDLLDDKDAGSSSSSSDVPLDPAVLQILRQRAQAHGPKVKVDEAEIRRAIAYMMAGDETDLYEDSLDPVTRAALDEEVAEFERKLVFNL